MDGTGAGRLAAGMAGWSDGWLAVAGPGRGGGGSGGGSALQVEGAHIEPLLWKELPCSPSLLSPLALSHPDRYRG